MLMKIKTHGVIEKAFSIVPSVNRNVITLTSVDRKTAVRVFLDDETRVMLGNAFGKDATK